MSSMNTTIIINIVRKICFQIFFDLGQPNIQTNTGGVNSITKTHMFVIANIKS